MLQWKPRLFALLAVLAIAAAAFGQFTWDAIDQLTNAGFAVDYVADHDGRRLAAVRLAGVRLIDNVPLPGAA